jgi:lambda repressor-like predicted transcriptional regulator
MQKGNKWISLLIVGSLVTVLGLGLLAYTSARAAFNGPLTLVQDEDTQSEDEITEEGTTEEVLPKLPFFGKGGLGFFGHRGWFGGAIDYDSYLADALGISVEELNTARQTAQNAAIDEAVSRGYITEERADLMKARIALMTYIDKDALIADALGISVDELQAEREEGKSMRTLIDELELDTSEVRDALQANYEEAVQAAVDDGIITQDQADEILSGDGCWFGIGVPHGLRRGPHGFDEVPSIDAIEDSDL